MEVKCELLDQLAQTLYWNVWTLREIRKEIIRWNDYPGVRPLTRFYLEWGDPDEALRLAEGALEVLKAEHSMYWTTHPDSTIRNMVLKGNHLAEDT